MRSKNFIVVKCKISFRRSAARPPGLAHLFEKGLQAHNQIKVPVTLGDTAMWFGSNTSFVSMQPVQFNYVDHHGNLGWQRSTSVTVEDLGLDSFHHTKGKMDAKKVGRLVWLNSTCSMKLLWRSQWFVHHVLCNVFLKENGLFQREVPIQTSGARFFCSRAASFRSFRVQTPSNYLLPGHCYQHYLPPSCSPPIYPSPSSTSISPATVKLALLHASTCFTNWMGQWVLLKSPVMQLATSPLLLNTKIRCWSSAATKALYLPR